jgi:hypothetical protein
VIAHAFGNQVGIPFDDPRRNPDIFRVGSVVEQEIFAQILQTLAAEETIVTRSGIRRHHPLPELETENISAYRDHIAGQFVPEYGGGHDHASMVPATENLHVGPAGQRHFHSDQEVSVTDRGNSYRLYLQVLLAVKNSSHHLASHYNHLCG